MWYYLSTQLVWYLSNGYNSSSAIYLSFSTFNSYGYDNQYHMKQMNSCHYYQLTETSSGQVLHKTTIMCYVDQVADPYEAHWKHTGMKIYNMG